MNVGGSIYILKSNFLLKLEKVLDPPFKGLSILPVPSKQTVVSREFWEFHSMAGTIETVFASSIARCDVIWAIYNTLKLFLCLLLQ